MTDGNYITPTDELTSYMADIESRMFRTNQDVGANSNALMVWNTLREHAGLPRLTRDNLRQRHVDSTPNSTMNDVLDFEVWYYWYSVYRDHATNEARWQTLQEKGGRNFLFPDAE
jgi:hypothetical protein